jgi:pilus assembly protein Flp/PilA
MITKFVRDEEGATAIEYGLIASLIAIVIIIAVALVGTNLSTTFNSIANHLT